MDNKTIEEQIEELEALILSPGWLLLRDYWENKKKEWTEGVMQLDPISNQSEIFAHQAMYRFAGEFFEESKNLLNNLKDELEDSGVKKDAV